MAQKKVFALLASDGSACFDELRAHLKSRGMEVWMAGSCKSALRLLEQTHPEVVFTAVSLTDGAWVQIVDRVREMSVPINVIVVGKHADTRAYRSAIEQGAFDFILPPFETDLISQVGRTAAENARRRRRAEALKAITPALHPGTGCQGPFPFPNPQHADWRQQ
ncbi:MAG TPA: response regulator [Terriglobia bacterium]|nr:response regulator [Terriglobia bacterium]